MRNFHSVCVVVCMWVLSTPAAASDEPAWFRSWVRACEEIPGSEVEWRYVEGTADERGAPSGAKELKVTTIHRWPDCYRREVVLQDIHGPGILEAHRPGHAMNNEYSLVVTPNAERWRLRIGYQDARELGIDLVAPKVMTEEMLDAPWLLGRWIAGHPDRYSMESKEEGRVEVLIPDLEARVTFMRDDDSAAVTQIDLVRSGTLRVRHAYADFRKVEGFPGLAGHSRKVLTADTSRSDRLIAMLVRSGLGNGEFSPERTRMGSRVPGLIVQTGRMAPIQSPESAARTVIVVPERVLVIPPRTAWWKGGGIVLAVGVVGLLGVALWLRWRAKSA